MTTLPPRWRDPLREAIRALVLLILAAGFAYNLATDGDTAVTLALVAGLFAAIGIDQNARNKGG